MIRIAQAASSEVHTKDNPGVYGTPPNQTRTGVTASKPYGNLDGELNIIPFYSYNWLAVFRFKDTKIADKAARIAERCVQAWNKVGYGQQISGAWNIQRYGLFDALFKMAADPDPFKIETPVNCDCGQLIGTSVYNAGVYSPDLRKINTSLLPDLLMATGAFIKLTDRELLESGYGVQRGDIFWRWGHTMMALDSDESVLYKPAQIENCSHCNMRTGPGTEFPKIRELDVGDIVAKVSEADNGWSQVLYDGDYGYVSPLYCKDLPEAYATQDVWMRSKPGVINSSTEVMVIPKGAIVYLTKQTTKVGLTTWYEVIYSGRRGWSSGKLVKPL